jgi:hypothetical protein
VSRLSYHQNVFDLLDIEPAPSEAALRMIEECERRCQKRLPAAVRDWYALDGVVHLPDDPLTVEYGYLWWDYSNDDHPVALAEVLRAFERGVGAGPRSRRPDVTVLVENQGCCSWYIRLDGSDDPPVRVDLDFETGGSKTVAPHFSEFVFDWIAGYYCQDYTPLSHKSYRARDFKPYMRRPLRPKLYAKGLWLRSPREPALLPPHIDHLIETLREEPHHMQEGGPTTYRFTAPGARLRVTTDHWEVAGGHSAWWLHASSARALADLARRVWHIGSLSRSLLASTEAAQAVLERLRAPGPGTAGRRGRS